ncbi:MAG: hypothetical protein KGJ02_04815 [Verrucomicrobiota bacterium]|nr:hypothetical protein [Verrucomicrobiota bacterium]
MHRLILLAVPFLLLAKPHPIQFALSETKMVKEIPPKDRDFAVVIPGDISTYVYSEEKDYYKDYQRSYFAVTKKKGGWDCMRHYEILANGCIPYFLDLEECPSKTMTLLPKKLILEAMHLPGVSYLEIDHRVFDENRYYEILEELLDYTRERLVARKMAQKILDRVKYKGKGKILYLSKQTYPDYLRCCMLIGLKELLGPRVVDVPKVEHIYTNYPENTLKLYGKGFSYTKVVEDEPVDRENIKQRIKKKEFDLIIYGSVHRGLLFHSLVRKVYPKEKIVYLCGEDEHKCKFKHYHNLFLREYP